MSNQNNGGPAFPHDSGISYRQGMTLRQYAAIKLRVPNSGDEWLDDMIRKSLRDEFAAKAMQADLEYQGLEGREDLSHIAAMAYEMADAMLKERDK